MSSLAKKTLIFSLVIAAVVTAGWVGRKAYRKGTEHRLVAQAEAYLEKKDIRNASLCLQRALQLNPVNIQACKLTADMLESVGSPEALSWRIRAVQINPLDSQLRFAVAASALKANNPSAAASALAAVDDQGRQSAEFHKLAGALAWSTGHAADAEAQYLEALQLEPTNLAVRINLATIHLSSTNVAVANAARASLEEMATNSTLKLTALRYLVEDAAAHKAADRALSFSRRILQDPECAFGDKIHHLQLLEKTRSPEFAGALASVKQEAQRDPNSAFLLGQWMLSTAGPTNALAWLATLPPATRTNAPVPLVITDCLFAERNWPDLLSLVNSQDWGDFNYYRLMLETAAHRAEGNGRDATTAWQRALTQATHRLDRLTRMAQVTSAWGWNSERVEVLNEVVTEFPREKWAAEQLSAIFYANGNTRELGRLMTRIYMADPSNNRIKNNLANIMLLEKSDLQKANELARDAYQSSTNNPYFASTYAYSLLLQDKTAQASEVISGIKPEYLKIPSVAAYYGTVEARSGHRDLAREPLALAETGHLLPEEKELVQTALAQK